MTPGLPWRQCRFMLLAANLLLVYPGLAIADWQSWWKTPEQQALQAYESGDIDALMQVSPNDAWTGVGQYQQKDYVAASRSFGKQAEALLGAGETDQAISTRYNQGVSDVMAGQYQTAIEHFDEVLAEQPEHVNAQHNKAIAEQLLKLQEQGEQQQQGDQGDQEQDSEAGESGESSADEGGESSSNSDSEESSDEASDNSQTDTPSEPSDSDGQSGEQNDNEQSPESSPTEAEQAQQEADAKRALSAEAEEQKQQPEGEADSPREAAVQEAPLTEDEQALEQLLRRIPDDPAGLLRRKLEQSHRTQYPEIRDAAEPW